MTNKNVLKRFGALLLGISMMCTTCFTSGTTKITKAQENSSIQSYTDSKEMTYLTLSNLGIESGTYGSGASGSYEQGFDNTMLSFFATSEGDYTPRIHFGSWGETDRTGINVLFYGEALVVGNDGFDGDTSKKIDYTRTEISASDFGVTSFLNQKILYQLETEYLALDSDEEENDIRFTLYVNREKAVSVDIKDQVDKLGKYIFFCDGVHTLQEYQCKPLSSSTENTYERVTFSDFNIPDGSLSGVGDYTVNFDSTIDKTLFHAKMNFPKTAFGNLIWGGSDWFGINITGDGTNLYITAVSTNGTADGFAIEPNVAGISLFENDNLEFAISTEFIELDDVAGTTKLKIGVWLNGELYNGQYFTTGEVALTDLTRHMHGKNLPASLSGASVETEKVLDESGYTCYTLSDAGISDGKGSIFGRLLDSDSVDVSGSEYNKVLFGAKVTLKTTGSRIHYATNAGDEFNGIQIRLQEDGSLILQDYSSESAEREVLNYQTMVIEPGQFGYESFVEQPFKMQLTTDLIASASSEKNDVRLGIWIDGKLANNTYCYIIDQLNEFGSCMNFSQDPDALRYSLWDIEAPKGMMENYVQLTEKAPYLVEADVFTNEHSEASYTNGDEVTVAGDYKASYQAEGEFAAGEKSVVLWKSSDLHADGIYDVRDLVAIKKAAKGTLPTTKAGQKAASQLESISDCDAMRDYLVGVINTLDTDVPAIYYQTDEDGKVMPISGWVTPAAWLGFEVDATGEFTANYKQYGVETDFLQDKYYKMIQDLGINLLAYQEKNYAEYNEMQVLRGLSLAEQSGINFYVHDSGISDDEDDETVLAKRMKAYSRYSSFSGIHVTDEPKTDYFNSDVAGVKYINEIGKKATLLNSYANLIGYANLSTGGDTDVYRQYVEEYIKTCHPTMLSFDHYPFANGGSIPFYLGSLKVIREQAIANNIPFGGCVGTSTTSYNTKPNTEVNATTQGQINWSVNTLLAYGAKGYTWFTLIQPRNFALYGDEENGITKMDFERAGLIGADGSETPVYPMAKAVNNWVGKIDSILMDSESLGVLAVGNDAKNDTGYTESSYGNMTLSIGDSLAEMLKEGIIAGVFNYKGQMAYYVVNHDIENEQDVTLEFETASDLTVYEQTTDVVNGVSNVTTHTLTLAAGAAALVIVE